MSLYKTHSLLVADLTEHTPYIVSILRSEWQGLCPHHPLDADTLESLFDWVVIESLYHVLVARRQYVEIANHARHDLYYCLYTIPSVKALIDQQLQHWLNSLGLVFPDGARLKVLVTYSQLLLVRSV